MQIPRSITMQLLPFLVLVSAMIAPVAAQERDLWHSEPALPDPALEGWTSEVVGAQAQSAIKGLLDSLFLHDRRGDDWGFLDTHFAESVTVRPLFPRDKEIVYQKDGVTVQRAANSPATAEQVTLESALDAVASFFAGTAHVHTKVKTIRVATGVDKAPTTTHLLWLSAAGTDGRRSVKLRWQCTWEKPSDNHPIWRLASLISEPSYFESAVATGASPWLEDQTGTVLKHSPATSAQLAAGFNYWTHRMERLLGFDIYDRNGLAIGDANGDGFDDVYICQPGGLPNRLLLRMPDGTVRDAAAEAGLDILNTTRAALWIDLDNDGDQDLALTARMLGVAIYLNDGSGKFRRQFVLEGAKDLESISAVDYDNDGDLDLFACAYYSDAAISGESRASIFTTTSAGGRNMLIGNLLIESGKLGFRDVTEHSGLGVAPDTYTLAAGWEDFDRDGNQDLYLANDYGHNQLFRNEGGTFVEVGKPMGSRDFGAGMAVSWGDIDRDSWSDLYVSNMFSSAGNRLTTQPGYGDLIRQQDVSLADYQHFAKGNSLFRNSGGKTFTETAARDGVEVAFWAWSSAIADLNNDGWGDIAVANGYITGDKPGDL